MFVMFSLQDLQGLASLFVPLEKGSLSYMTKKHNDSPKDPGLDIPQFFGSKNNTFCCLIDFPFSKVAGYVLISKMPFWLNFTNILRKAFMRVDSKSVKRYLRHD
jgi:hypothetical protein